MKFFEYPVENGYYYALIAASSLDESNKALEEEVEEIGDDFIGPNEISEADARQKYDEVVAEDSESNIGFDEAVKYAPTVLLIGSDLI